MEGSSASSSSCTVTYVDETASVSCVDSTSSGYQVILLQDSNPYNLTVINVSPGEKQTVPVVPSGRYCIMELPMGDDFDSEVKYSREFMAEETSIHVQPSTVDVIGIASKLNKGDDLQVPCDLYKICSWCCGTVHIHGIDHTNNCCMCGYYQDKDKNREVC